MSQDTQQFESLRKLLALKRHEQPPPGYHDQLASEIKARLQGGEHRQTDLWKELGDEAGWTQRLLSLFGARPVVAGGFAVLACGLVLSGIYLAQVQERPATIATAPLIPKMETPLAMSHDDAQLVSATASNGPVVNSLGGATPFDKIGIGGQPVPVSLPVGGR